MSRPKPVNVRHMPIMAAKCKTCPFRDDGPGDLRAKIERRVLSSASQTCHSTGVAIGKRRDTHLCRGARDLQLTVFFRLGLLAEPTDEAWEKKCRELGL